MLISSQQVLAPGTHCLATALRVGEGFGWGLALTAHGEGLRWLPVELGREVRIASRFCSSGWASCWWLTGKDFCCIIG